MRKANPNLGAFNLPHTPLRHNQGASALLISDTIDVLTSSDTVISLYLVNSMFLLWIIAQGILGLIESQWDQVTVRNWVFRKFAGITPKRQRATFGSKIRYYFGKAVAGFYFLTAIALAFCCPFIFVSSVIINEFVTWSWPVSESYDAIGQVSCLRSMGLFRINVLQWSTWASAAFVLIAAIIQRYHIAWWKSVKLGYATVVHTIKWICGKEEFWKEPKEKRTKENSVIEDTKEFFRQCAKPFIHSRNSTVSALRQMRGYWREYKAWHNDPVGVSTRILAQHAPSSHGSVDVTAHSVTSGEDQSSLEHPDKHATPHEVPLSSFATLPPHKALSPIGSFKSKPKLTTRSQSQSSMIQTSPPTSPLSSKSKIAPPYTRSNTGDTPRPLQPFPRSAFSSSSSSAGQDLIDPRIPRRHFTEPVIPAQAAWAPTALQPQQDQVE